MAPKARNKSQKEMAAENYKRILRWLVTGLVLISLVAGGVAVARYVDDPSHLPLKYVRLTGDLVHLNREALQALVTNSIDGGFFTVNLDRIREEVEAMPWVDQVRLKRIWPETLLLNVVEQKPVARWGQSSLVTSRGLVFTPDEKQLADYPVNLHGPEGSTPMVVNFYLGHLEDFTAVDLNVRSISLNERRDWSLQFASGLELLMTDEEAEKQLARFLRLYPRLAKQEVEKRSMKRVDLRYQHGFAILWRDIEADPMGQKSKGEA